MSELTRAEVLAQQMQNVDRLHRMYNGYNSRLRKEMKKWSETRSVAYSMGPEYNDLLINQQQRLNLLILECISVYQDIIKTVHRETVESKARFIVPAVILVEDEFGRRETRVPNLEEEEMA